MSHGLWALSPQVLVSYYRANEEAPLATAVLYLTGIGEPHPHGGEPGALAEREEV